MIEVKIIISVHMSRFQINRSWNLPIIAVFSGFKMSDKKTSP